VTFRDGLLSDRRVAFAGASEPVISEEVHRLGAWVAAIDDAAAGDEQAASTWVAERLPLTALVFDARSSFEPAGTQGLQNALERAWITARAVATGALIAAEIPGRLLFIAPRPDAGPHADAVRAGLENLARTLSVEWARFGITAAAICPGVQTTDHELATLTIFLVSQAGGYFTGCRFDLGTVDASSAFITAS
jgi:NAD(P)-dependent dehydrogenase (short-subunit alcohol dehydrogenase family)